MTQLSRRFQEPGFQRALFRRINVLMLLTWRLGLGRLINLAPAITGRVMVLGTVGRRTGQIRRFPVTYAPFDGGVHCLAGFGKSTQWYRNVLAHPDVELWLPSGRFTGRARPLDASEHLDIMRDVLVASAFASRVFEGLDPRTVDDPTLGALADRFPPVRIIITGRAPFGRHDDLRWTWAAAAAILVLLRRATRPAHRPSHA